MSGRLPGSTTWADDTDSDVDEVVVTRPSAPAKKQGMSWADSDTESDADNAPPAPEKKRDAFGESESDSEESGDDEEDEEEDEEEEEEANGEAGGGAGGGAREDSEDEGEEKLKNEAMREGKEGVRGAVVSSGTSVTPALTGDDPSQSQNLSKKERKALKQRQLDDLDALLGEFGLGGTPAAAPEVEPAVPAPTNGASAGGILSAEAGSKGEGGDATKKPKKKKKKDKKESDGSKGQAAPAHEEAPVVVVQPISEALKNKTKKKSAPAAARPTAATLKALKEAADKEAKKKRKKDKKNFNQAPPGK